MLHDNVMGLLPIMIPTWLVYIAAISISISKRNTHKKQATIVFIAMSLAFCLSIAGLLRSNWVWTSLDAGMDPVDIGFASGYLNFFLSLGHTGAILAVVIAAFIKNDSTKLK